MTLLKPGGVREYAAQNWTRQVRLLTTLMLHGVDGTGNTWDFEPTGNNTSMDVSLFQGWAYLHMPTPFQGANVFVSDSPYTKTLGSAPAGGTRYDVIGIQVWDQEYGDSKDDWDIVVLTNPAINSKVLPTPSPSTCKWYPLFMVAVPHGVTSAAQCTFTRLSKQTAYTRSGGYGGDDLNAPQDY
jgi:hypothetical protein